MMASGQLKRYEIQSKVYKLKEELRLKHMHEDTYLAEEYLNKVLDYINQFTY